MNIPKRISFFWSGGALSWMRYMTFWSFRLNNPDWEIHLYLATECQHKKTWATGEVQDFGDEQNAAYTGKNYLPELTKVGIKVSPWIPPADCKGMSPVHLADICRWGVLSKFGGWFADTDILWVDSMARVETRYNLDAKAHEERHGPGSFRPPDVAWPICRDWLPTGLIGTVPETRFAGDCYLMARGSIDQRDYHSSGRGMLLKQCGLDPKFPAEKKDVVRGLTTAFPGTLFWMMHHLTLYRWEWFDAGRIFSADEEVLLETVGIHWYAGSRAGQKANRKYDASNFRQDKNTWTRYAANLIDGTSE